MLDRLLVLMPPYLKHVGNWQALWPLPVAVLIVVAIALAAIWRTSLRARAAEVALGIAAFSMLGLVAGYLTGFSRSPAVGAVVPAVLSLIGVLAAFLMHRDRSSRVLVASLVLVFATMLALGTSWGAVMRQVWEEVAVSYEAQKRKTLIELEIRELRQSLGLPVEPQKSGAEPAEVRKD